MFTSSKNGQSSLVIVVITMVTILGVAFSGASKSRVNLRDATDTTQGARALSCAESGIEIALVDSDLNSDAELADKTLTDDLGDCSYSAKITNYPGNDNKIIIPGLKENSIQEIRHDESNIDIDIKLRPLDTSENMASIGIFAYKNDGTVERNYYTCGSTKPSADFSSLTKVSNECELNNFDMDNVVLLRIRPLYSDMHITISDYAQKAGYRVESTGFSGSAERKVYAYRYYSQLPDGFDLAVLEY